MSGDGRGFIYSHTNQKNMTKLIIIDLGGVLVPEKWPEIRKEICEFMECDEEAYFKATEPYVPDLRKGNLTLRELYVFACKKLECKKDPLDIFNKHFELYKQISTARNPEMIALIEELKVNYRVVALTNTEKEIGDYNKEQGLFQYFEKAFLSSDMGEAKPDEEIYEMVLKECNTAAEDALFIDNDESYIEGAMKVGITCVLFENVAQCKAALKVLL
jgi:HAD superfamily hydrolase (TIGR01509 family)